MGIFDNILAPFTTDAAEKAAAAQKASIDKGLQTYGQFAETGRNALTSGYGAGQGVLAPLLGTATNAFNFAGDITGAGGAEGQARAGALFQADPGYQYALQQAEDSILRNQAGAGMLSSGNTLSKLNENAVGMAGNQYKSWADRALQFAGMAPGVAGQSAGLHTGLADRLLASNTAQGQLGYQGAVGQGDADAKAALDENRAGAQFWNTALGLGQLAAGAFGGRPPNPTQGSPGLGGLPWA